MKVRHGRTRLLRQFWVLTFALVCAAAAVGKPSAAFGAVEDELDPDEVLAVESFVPAGKIEKPDDGRLRGHGFAARVEGVAEAAAVERVFSFFRPPPGQRIVVFGFQFEVIEVRDELRAVHGTVVVDGRRVAISKTEFEASGPRLVAVAVPTDAQRIEFELAAAEVAQTFSLTDLKRVGPQPAILYRDPTSPEVVSDVNTERFVRVSDEELTSSAVLMLRRARLSFFPPAVPGDDVLARPSSTERAFLIIEGGGTGTASGPGSPNHGSFFDKFDTVPPADVRATLPDGTSLQARHVGGGTGLLAGSYYFEVPADTTAVTLLIGPTTVRGTRNVRGVATTTNVRIEGTTFEVTLRSGGSPVHFDDTPTMSTIGAPTPQATDDSGESTRPITWLAAILAIILGGWFVARNVRRHSVSERVAGEALPSEVAEAANEEAEPVGILSLVQHPWVHVVGVSAVEAVRAAVVHTASGARSEDRATNVVVLALDETEQLVPTHVPMPPWLSVVHDGDTLFAQLDLIHLKRARLHDRLETEYAAGRPRPLLSEEPPVLIAVPGTIDDAVLDRLQDGLRRTQGAVGVADYRMTVVSVGGAGSPSIRVDDARAVVEGEMPPSSRHVATMSETEAATKLAHAAAGTPKVLDAEPDEPEAALTATASSNDGPVIVLRLLGPYAISAAGREVASGLRTKARELLAFLAVNRDGVRGDTAIEALWPGSDPEKTQGYFRTVLANVRTVLRGATGLPDTVSVVNRVGSRYRLDPSLVDVDLWHFEDALEAADGGGSSNAAAAYGGLLMEAEDFAWAEPVRARLHRKAINNLTALADRRRAAGDLDGAVQAAEQAVECDQYAEELYQRVMALHRERHSNDGVRRTYELLEARLGDLGRVPGARSQALATGADEMS